MRKGSALGQPFSQFHGQGPFCQALLKKGFDAVDANVRRALKRIGNAQRIPHGEDGLLLNHADGCDMGKIRFHPADRRGSIPHGVQGVNQLLQGRTGIMQGVPQQEGHHLEVVRAGVGKGAVPNLAAVHGDAARPVVASVIIRAAPVTVKDPQAYGRAEAPG